MVILTLRIPTIFTEFQSSTPVIFLLRDASEKTRLFISQEGQTIIRCGGATDNYILISPNVVQIVVNGVVKESWS